MHPRALRLLVLLASCLPLVAQPAPTRADVRYGPHERNVLDFWSAEPDGEQARPLLVYIHGGGWYVGDKSAHRRFVENYLPAGIHCAAVNYRLVGTDPLPAPVLDAARAIQFLRSKAEDWHIDPSRIAVWGTSAGACTSLWLACHDDLADPNAKDPIARQSTRVVAAWGHVGQTSIEPEVISAWVGPKILDHPMIWRAVGEKNMASALAHLEEHADLYREFSPITHVSSGDPPLFLTYGSDDSLPAKNASHAIHHAQLGVEMQKRCKAVGQSCELVVPGKRSSERFASGEHFLLHHLLRDPERVLRARAANIHRRVLTVDTHKDIDPKLAPESLPSDPKTRERFRRLFDPTVDGDAQVDFPKMRDGGYDCAFFIVYVGQGRLTPAGYARALRAANAKFDAIRRMVRLHGDIIGLATSPDEVLSIHRQGKLVACIGIENGYPMGEDLSLIETFHSRGARYMSLVHNRHSQLGDSHTPPEPLHGGLSELGRKAIAEMNRVGIMVDVSHASKATMMQAVAASEAPVIASHSGCRAVCDNSRNLDDEQLRALAANGGVVQCVALGSYVRAGNSPPASVRDFVDHIDHAVKVAGIDHVGISSDFDGGGGIVGWSNARETGNVTLELVRRGYTEPQIAKLWSGNILRVWRAVEAHAAREK